MTRSKQPCASPNHRKAASAVPCGTKVSSTHGSMRERALSWDTTMTEDDRCQEARL